MIIFINDPKEFELATILRTLYYSTKFQNIKIYVKGSFRDIDVIRYSRVPLKDYTFVIKKEPERFPKNTYVIDPHANKDISEIKNIECLIIDFSDEYKENFEKVKSLGLPFLHYEAVAVLYELFIKKLKQEIQELNNKIDKISIYLAKKLLEFVDQEFIDMKKIQYILQHIYPEKKILVQVDRQILKKDLEKILIEYFVTFYNKNMERIAESKIIQINNLIKIPVLVGKNLEIRDFFIDKSRRRVYITKDFWIEESKEISLPSWF